jgi:hypothetical protein
VTSFLEQMTPYAVEASGPTGFRPSVILAQWADETGFGTSKQWVDGHNPAGISPGGRLASYPSIAVGVGAYIATAEASYYDTVRNAGDGLAQAYALGASVWAAGHYVAAGSVVAGSALVAIIKQYGLQALDPPPVLQTPPAVVPNPQPQVEAAEMNALDPVTGGIWYLDPATGAVETPSIEGGVEAPYLGGMNNPPNRDGWQQQGALVGISAWPDPGGTGWGYCTLLRRNTPLPSGAYVVMYTFRRNEADIG